MSEQPIDAEAMKWALENAATTLRRDPWQNPRNDAEHAANDALAAELQARAAGHWTREAPTASGLYWVRYRPNGGPTAVVFSDAGSRGWSVEGMGWTDTANWTTLLAEGYERWSVPIEPPA